IEAGRGVEQGGNAAVDADGASVRRVHPGNDLQQCGLTRPVMSDQPESIAAAEGEGDVIKSAYDDALLTACPFAPDQPSSAAEQGLAQAAMTRPVDREIDRKVVRNDRGQGGVPRQSQYGMRRRKRA